MISRLDDRPQQKRCPLVPENFISFRLKCRLFTLSSGGSASQGRGGLTINHGMREPSPAATASAPPKGRVLLTGKDLRFLALGACFLLALAMGMPFITEQAHADQPPAEKDLTEWMEMGLDQEDDATGDETPESETTESLLDLPEDDNQDDEDPENTSAMDALTMDDEEADDKDEADEEDKVARSRATAVNAAMARLRKPLYEISLNDSSRDEVTPRDRAAESFQNHPSLLITGSGSMGPRSLRRTVCFAHRPLYFEQRSLERQGCGHGFLQNKISALHFIASTITLPYQMAKHPPHCPVPAEDAARNRVYE